MPANTKPIFPLIPNNPIHAPVLTANPLLDGTGTSVVIFTAGANGSMIEAINVTHLGTNAATVLRIFLNNGGASSTASNNLLWKEAALPLNTISQTAASTPANIYINQAIPAGYKILATVGTGIAAGLSVIVVGGDY